MVEVPGVKPTAAEGVQNVQVWPGSEHGRVDSALPVLGPVDSPPEQHLSGPSLTPQSKEKIYILSADSTPTLALFSKHQI